MLGRAMARAARQLPSRLPLGRKQPSDAEMDGERFMASNNLSYLALILLC